MNLQLILRDKCLVLKSHCRLREKVPQDYRKLKKIDTRDCEWFMIRFRMVLRKQQIVFIFISETAAEL